MRILVLRFSSLGDVALCRPVLLALVEQYPQAEVVFVSKKPFTQLMMGIANLKVFEINVEDRHKGVLGLFRLFFDLRALGHFDKVIDLHNVLRTKVLAALFYLSLQRVYVYRKDRKARRAYTRKESKIRNALTPVALSYGQVFEKAKLPIAIKNPPYFGNRKDSPNGKIGFAPFASNKQKTWPLELSRRLMELLDSEKFEVILFGSKEEQKQLLELSKGLINVECYKGNGNWQNEIEAIKQLKLMICMDSANMHLAALAGTPTLSIWGATHPDLGFGPMGSSNIIIQLDSKELSCRPCSVFGQYTCYRGDWACLWGISPQEVLKKVSRIVQLP